MKIPSSVPEQDHRPFCQFLRHRSSLGPRREGKEREDTEEGML